MRFGFPWWNGRKLVRTKQSLFECLSRARCWRAFRFGRILAELFVTALPSKLQMSRMFGHVSSWSSGDSTRRNGAKSRRIRSAISTACFARVPQRVRHAWRSIAAETSDKTRVRAQDASVLGSKFGVHQRVSQSLELPVKRQVKITALVISRCLERKNCAQFTSDNARARATYKATRCELA